MRDSMSSVAHTVGIVVTHNPSRSFGMTLGKLVPQVSAIVIVDNGSTSQILQDIRGAALRLGCHLISNPDNRGIASALNQGLEWALARGRKWALLIDQDTQLHDGAVESLAALYEAHPNRESLAVVAANFVDPTTGTVVLTRTASLDQAWFPAQSAITSGSLLSLSAHRKIGPFRDEFFIDHVDTEYCLRARRRGFEIIISAAPLMVHAIGEGLVRTFLGARTRISNHDPIRRYYATRNCVVLAKEYWNTELRYVFHLLKQLMKALVLVLLFEKEKGKKLLHALCGLRDGLRGRLGPYKKTSRSRSDARGNDNS